MSDDFDKEAEREKLREKYEQEEEERAVTQQMSELLLKGATMTNRHCDTCGDPVFRYDGQEFCPTCQAEGRAGGQIDQGGQQTAQEGQAQQSGQQAATEGSQDPQGDEQEEGAQRTQQAQQGDQSAQRPRQHGQSPQQAGGNRPRANATANEGQANRLDGRQGAVEQGRNQPRNLGQRPDHPHDSPQGGDQPSIDPADLADAGVEDAAASLGRTLTRFARMAEQTDDPRRAREYLAAAREAAETLDALR